MSFEGDSPETAIKRCAVHLCGKEIYSFQTYCNKHTNEPTKEKAKEIKRQLRLRENHLKRIEKNNRQTNLDISYLGDLFGEQTDKFMNLSGQQAEADQK
jgi:hypothetical protein